MPGVNNDTAGGSPNPDLPMSPLFVPSNLSRQDERGGEEVGLADTGAEQDSGLERQCLKDARRERRQQKRAKKLRRRQQRQQRQQRMRQSSRDDRHSRSESRNLSSLSHASGKEIARIDSMESSGVEEALEPTAETESGSAFGSSGIIGGNEQVLPDMDLAAVDELEHGPPIEEDHIFSEEEKLETSHAELRFEDEQRRGGTEESIAGRESLEDANMEEHSSEREDRVAERAEQRPSAEEVEKTLKILEGHGTSGKEPGPSRTVSRKSAALREGAKFKPYDRRQRRQQTPKLSIPPQETLEQEINTVTTDPNGCSGTDSKTSHSD